MADLRSLSVPEILAYCRKADGGGGGSAAQVPKPAENVAVAPESTESKASPAPSKVAAPATGAAKVDPKKMSVAEMLAAARGEKSAQGAAPQPTSSTTSAPSPATSAKPAGPLDRKKMSVAEMLAAARGEKSTSDKPSDPKPSPAASPAAKGAKPAAKPAAAASSKADSPSKAGPRDTSSVLAAARAGAAKPGPISKAEAAVREKGEPEKPAKPKAPPMPPKPEYARQVTASSASKPKAGSDRRGFFDLLFMSPLAIGFGAMTMSAGLSSLMLARFFFPNLLVEPPSRFTVGFPGDFAADTVATKFTAQFGIWLVNTEYEGVRQIVALKSVCTHLGCTPNWLEAEQKFKCPCHGSGFYKDGINFEGPAPRPLERYAISVADDGQVAVDKSKTFQEELGQWRDPSCFVPA